MERRFNWCVSGRKGVNCLSRFRCLAGFTALELLLVLSVMAVLSLVVTQPWSRLIQRQRFSAAVSALVDSVRFARMAAVMQSRVISLCGSSDARRCDGGWSRGFLVLDDRQHILRYRRQPIPQVRVDWFGGFGHRHYLKFAPSGFTLGQQGRFYLCAKPPLLQQNQAVVVNAGGRTRVEALPANSPRCL